MVTSKIVKKATGITIREIREFSKITKEGLSIDLGMDMDQLSRYEEGLELPDVTFLINHAEACGTIPEDTFIQIMGEIRRLEDTKLSV
jgi:transcriptional regulator with XRE-family HTH domain